MLPKIQTAFEANWVENLSADEYHAKKDFISSTGIRKILKSLNLFKMYCEGRITEEETESMKFGTLAHMAILEPTKFMENYKMIPEFWGYTKDGKRTDSLNCADVKEKKLAWFNDLPQGCVPVSQQEYDKLKAMAVSIISHQDAYLCLKNIKTEASGFYRDDETGILCRIRPDFISTNGAIVGDIKTTRSCERSFFEAEIARRKYHVQLAMYAAGAEKITNIKNKRQVIIAVENVEPHDCAVYWLNEGTKDAGLSEYRGAMRALKKSLDTDVWPRYQLGAQEIAIPSWGFPVADLTTEGDLE